MTESPTESAPEIVEEPKAPPVPEISPSSTDEPTSAASREAELLADALARIEVLEASKRSDEDLRTLIDRGIQSTKDVRFQDLETLRKFKKYLDKHEGDEEAAIKDMELDSMLAERRASTEVPGRTEVGAPRSADKDATADRLIRAREKYSLEISDEEVQELANSKRYYSDEEWLEDLDEFIVKKAKGESVTSAAAVGSGGGPVLPQSSKEVLQQQYDEEQKQIKSGTHPTIKRGNVQGIQEMKQKYKKQGLDIT